MILFDYNLINYVQANRDKWMTIPDMGYAIANRYNVILVCCNRFRIWQYSHSVHPHLFHKVSIEYFVSDMFTVLILCRYIFFLFSKNFISLLT